MNPTAAVRGPNHVVKTGKKPELEAAEWRTMVDSIPIDTARDLIHCIPIERERRARFP